MVERSNAVSAMCQQLSQGLSLLSSNDDPFLANSQNNVRICSAFYSKVTINTGEFFSFRSHPEAVN